MARKKVTLAYISNDSKRKASYKKREKKLIKKVSELSTHYGVDACAIIYNEYDSEPVVWPSQLGAQDILARYQKVSHMDQGPQMVNHESFIRGRIEKAEDELRRLQKERKCREFEWYLYQQCAGNITLDDIHFSDVEEMNWVMDQALRNIQAKQDARMAEFHRGQALAPAPSLEVSSVPAAASAGAVAASLRPRM